MIEIKLTWEQVEDLKFILFPVVEAIRKLPHAVNTGVVTGKAANREYKLKFAEDGVIIKLTEGGKDNG